MAETCADCGREFTWHDCAACEGDGYILGEESRDFEDECPSCEGNGGWWACPEEERTGVRCQFRISGGER